MPYSYDDHTCDALAYTMYERLTPPAYNVFLDYSAEEARGAFGGSVACVQPKRGQPMFTFKPTNDTEEFYAAIKKLETKRILKKISHSPEFIAKMRRMAEEISRNHRSLPLPTAPSSSEASTSPSPCQPHVADVP